MKCYSFFIFHKFLLTLRWTMPHKILEYFTWKNWIQCLKFTLRLGSFGFESFIWFLLTSVQFTYLYGFMGGRSKLHDAWVNIMNISTIHKHRIWLSTGTNCSIAHQVRYFRYWTSNFFSIWCQFKDFDKKISKIAPPQANKIFLLVKACYIQFPL